MGWGDTFINIVPQIKCMPEMTEEQRKAWEEKIKNMSPEELAKFQKQQCIFCQIVSGKVPSKKIYEDEQSIAILDINPATKGHILLLPKEHYAIMPQVPEKEISHLFLVSKYLSQMILKTLRASGTNIFVANGLAAGQRAQHFMIHIIPRREGDHLFPIEEKLIDKTMQEKIKSLVVNRLNTALGVKKEVVTEQKKEKPKEPEEKKISEESREKQSESKIEEQPKNKEEHEEESEIKNRDKEDITLDDIANLFK